MKRAGKRMQGERERERAELLTTGSFLALLMVSFGCSLERRHSKIRGQARSTTSPAFLTDRHATRSTNAFDSSSDAASDTVPATVSAPASPSIAATDSSLAGLCPRLSSTCKLRSAPIDLARTTNWGISMLCQYLSRGRGKGRGWVREGMGTALATGHRYTFLLTRGYPQVR